MSLDHRLNAYRDDLADAKLRGTVDACRFSDGIAARVAVGVTPCLRRAEASAPLDTEFLFGEPLTVFDEAGGFAWVQSGRDGYVGYVHCQHITPGHQDPTHRVCVPLAFVYAEPSIKVPVTARLPLGSALVLSEEATVGGERFRKLENGGHILAQHVAPWDERDDDFVAIAEQFIGSPYLFGGKSWLGIDCSSLVQIALDATGVSVLRDTDMQANTVGTALPNDPAALTRGDLIYWKGHTGIMLDAETLLHANGYHMVTATEPARTALSRLAALGLEPTAFRRIER